MDVLFPLIMFDDRSQPRINVEAEVILTILGMIEKNSIEIELVSSEAIDYEVSRILDTHRKNKTN